MEINTMTSELVVRGASLEDAKRIWEIRNHPASRQESLNQNEIPLNDHLSWFKNKYFENQDNACFVLEHQEMIAGYCRLDYENNSYVVSIAIDPGYHGKGLGTILLGESLHQLNTNKIVLATVKKDNPASLRIFEKNGFIPITDDATSIYLKKS